MQSKYSKWYWKNRERIRARRREQRAARKDEINAKRRSVRYSTPERKAKEFKRNYNCSSTIEEIILVQQQKSCGICGRSDKKLMTDHCHITKRVRAMLCPGCNILAQSPERLRAVLAYVEKFYV